MFPGQIEHAVRSIAGIGDEFEIVLITNADGLDVMTVRVEHHAGDIIAAAVTEEIRTRCEVRAAVEVLAPGTLPRTEFKAARVKDRREKPAARPARAREPGPCTVLVRRLAFPGFAADIEPGRLAVDEPLANRVRSGRKQP